MLDDDGPDTSFFSDYLNEVAGPFVIETNEFEFTVDAPDPKIGNALDAEVPYLDLFEILTECLDDDDFTELDNYFQGRPHGELTAVVEDMLDHWALVGAPRDGGFSRVVAEFDRYGADIEFDLATMGVELALWITDHERYSWNKLFRFLRRLPAGGHYSAALAMDVELAEAMAEQREKDKAAGVPADNRPSLIGWNFNTAMQQAALDQMRRLEWAMFASSPKFKGKGGKAPAPSQRPRTAADLVHTRARWVEHDDIAGQLLGKRYKPRNAS